jgi:hypothetical protein
MPDDSKRAASTCPTGDPNRDSKRPRLSPDLWSEDEHLQQDKMVRQRVRRNYNVKDVTHMAVVLKLVGDVALEGPYSHLLHVPAKNEHYIAALEDDPGLMKVVGDSYTSDIYKDVRCHGMSYLSV